MPQLPLRGCRFGGCPELVRGRAYCERHAPQVEQERVRRQDRIRGSASARGYGRWWQKVRRRALEREPLCRFCKEQGITEAATEVDHIDGNPRNNAMENLRPLCKPCHSRRTIRDQGPNARRA